MPSQVLQTDYAAVYCAWQRFRAGKRASQPIDKFAYDIENNLSRLATELADRSYCHGGYERVVLQEKKRRDLAVAGVRDRVAHRLLYDYLNDIYDKSFDPDVWSCRVGKGLHKGLSRTQQLLRQHRRSYIWRADITKFFDSVNHTELLACLERKTGTYDPAVWLSGEIIDSYHIRGAGIPIGNLTSQIFANIYLHEFDRVVRHQLKPQAYLRYGDDFLLFAPTRQAAYSLRSQAINFLDDRLNLTINPKNDAIIGPPHTLKFLGHAITEEFAVVDKHTTKSILGKIDHRNASSYRSLPLAQTAANQLDWILLEKYVDI
ncbi:MAG TPA: reverse transcriptase/maturase family protein [Candidatus Saccharimonadales bacterium]|nr:reverse transcriptase/maturase family protein [Candidatus Saccharimonadales bacterium]